MNGATNIQTTNNAAPIVSAESAEASVILNVNLKRSSNGRSTPVMRTLVDGPAAIDAGSAEAMTADEGTTAEVWLLLAAFQLGGRSRRAPRANRHSTAYGSF